MYLRIFYILLYVRIPASLLFATQFLGWSLSRRENATLFFSFGYQPSLLLILGTRKAITYYLLKATCSIVVLLQVDIWRQFFKTYINIIQFRRYDFLQREQLTDYTFCLSLNFRFVDTRFCRRSCRQRGISTAVPKKDKWEKRQVYISELLNRLGLEEPQEGYLKKKGDIQHQFKMISRRRISYSIQSAKVIQGWHQELHCGD